MFYFISLNTLTLCLLCTSHSVEACTGTNWFYPYYGPILQMRKLIMGRLNTRFMVTSGVGAGVQSSSSHHQSVLLVWLMTHLPLAPLMQEISEPSNTLEVLPGEASVLFFSNDIPFMIVSRWWNWLPEVLSGLWRQLSYDLILDLLFADLGFSFSASVSVYCISCILIQQQCLLSLST